MHRRLRLRHRRDFTRLRQSGTVCSVPGLRLSYLPNELTNNRYGFVVGKRMGNAVKRNRIRRLLRESVRLLHPRLQQGFDMAIIAHPNLRDKTFDDIQQLHRLLFIEAGILKEL